MQEKYTKVVLTKSNASPDAFMGIELASGDTKEKGDLRWTQVKVYRTDKGEIVVGVAHKTCWRGEKKSYVVSYLKTLDEVEQVLTTADLGSTDEAYVEKYKAMIRKIVEDLYGNKATQGNSAD